LPVSLVKTEKIEKEPTSSDTGEQIMAAIEYSREALAQALKKAYKIIKLWYL